MADPLPPGFVMDEPLPEGFVHDAPNSPAAPKGDNEWMHAAISMAKLLSRFALPGGAVPFATDNAQSLARGVARSPEPASADLEAQVANVAGRMAIPAATGIATGALMGGPFGAGLGGLRGVAGALGAEAVAGGLGEAAGQGVAYAAGNRDALSLGEVGGQALLSGGVGATVKGGIEGAKAVARIPAVNGAMKAGAIRLMELGEKYGIQFSAADITKSKVLQSLESFLEKSPTGGSFVDEVRDKDLARLMSIKAKAISEFGAESPDAMAAGAALQEAVSTRSQSFKNAEKELFRRTMESVDPNAPIPVRNLEKTVSQIMSKDGKSPLGHEGMGVLRKIHNYFNPDESYLSVRQGAGADASAFGDENFIAGGRAGKSGPAPKPEAPVGADGFPIERPGDPASLVPPAGGGSSPSGFARDGITSSAPSGEFIPASTAGSEVVRPNRIDLATGFPIDSPKTLTPEGLMLLRSQLGGMIADYDAGAKLGIRQMSSREAGVMKRLFASLSEDLNEYAAVSGGKFASKYENARKLTKLGAGIFQDKNLVGILGKNAEDVVPALIRPNSISEVRAIKAAVGEKGFEEVRRNFVAGLLKDQDGAFRPNDLNKRLSEYGDATLSEIFKGDPKALETIREIGELQGAMRSADSLPGTHGSSRMNQSVALGYSAATAAGSVVGAMAGGSVGAAAGAVIGTSAYALTPYGLAKLYTSPAGRQLLLKGIGTSAAENIAASRVAAQILAHVGPRGFEKIKKEPGE
jgi:hypothetical protein